MKQKKLSIPRPEYPRPQMVRDNWLNLNGIWEFQVDAGLSGEERGLYQGGEFSQTINVPFCPESKLSGINYNDFLRCIWYRRKFHLPGNWRKMRIFLHFGAVDYEATVWVNGEKAGTHRGGYTPFSFEITPLLKKEENLVVVRARDDVRSHLQPSGKQSPKWESYGGMYTRTSGIWQTVWLEAVPSTFIQSFRLYPDLDRGKVSFRVNINGEVEGLILNTKIFASGKKVGEREIPARNWLFFSIKLSEIYPWQVDKPFLYDIEFSLKERGKCQDKVKSYFGLRKIEIQGKKVFLNNRPIFQRLVLDQGFYPEGIYTAPTMEALRQDIELSLSCGFNGARLHQKVFEPYFLYWADKRGYLVWEEYPNWGIDHSHPAALKIILKEWLEVIERDFNHPSIIGWCPFNETPQNQDPELIQIIYRTTKSIDPTRPVIDTSGYHHIETDIYDCHNYEQDPEKFSSSFEAFKKGGQPWRNDPENQSPYQGQPYFVSEYGGTWWNPHQKNNKAWGYGKRPETEEEFLERYRRLTQALLFHPRISGFCYTQLYDIEQEVNGLYTYQRCPKFDLSIIKKINSQKAAIEE